MFVTQRLHSVQAIDCKQRPALRLILVIVTFAARYLGLESLDQLKILLPLPLGLFTREFCLPSFPVVVPPTGNSLRDAAKGNVFIFEDLVESWRTSRLVEMTARLTATATALKG